VRRDWVGNDRGAYGRRFVFEWLAAVPTGAIGCGAASFLPCHVKVEVADVEWWAAGGGVWTTVVSADAGF